MKPARYIPCYLGENKHICCPKQVEIGCVCRAAFDCPDHGGLHVGSHD